MIYELRIYEVAPGKMPALNARFANQTMKFFEKHGIKVVGFWTEEVGTSNNLIYMTAFDSWADRERRWGAFQQDPEWVKLRDASQQEGPMVLRIHNSLLRPTAYSPLK